jgi:hypothetical protein
VRKSVKITLTDYDADDDDDAAAADDDDDDDDDDEEHVESANTDESSYLKGLFSKHVQ